YSGLFCAAAWGHRILLFWKPLEQSKSIPTYRLPSYYKGGFEQKMSRQKLSLILGVTHRRIMGLNYPDKDGLPSLAIQISEPKEFTHSLTEPWNGLGWRAP
uniref:Uncharacterized protein n=1 Tax=Junco hyemalis TaxID=40217 RepID=A0A8C5IY19_JUNHY